MCATTKQMRETVYSPSYQGSLKSHPSLLELAAIHLKNHERLKSSRLKTLLEFDQNERFPSYILRRVDHLSMAHAIEVRIPFCQAQITAFAAELPESYLLDESAVKKIIYEAAKPLLPNSILNRPKQPFTLPITAMLNSRHVLLEILCDTLNSQSFINRGYFNHTVVKDLIREQVNRPNNQTADMLWSLMILELWMQKQY
jgi:asparagine synthase (glutamine-hydrolysing)